MSNELLIPETLTGVEVYANDDNPERHLELISRVSKEAKALVPDVTTAKGRDEIKSMAYKVSRSKTALDNLGKELTENARKTIDAVNAKRKRIRDDLDTLRDEVRKPLTDWEEVDKKRIDDLRSKLTTLASFQHYSMSELTCEQISQKLEECSELARSDWQEFKEEAETTWNNSRIHLNRIFEGRKKYDAEQEELERLRKEQAEKDAELEQLRKEKAEREAEELRKSQEAKGTTQDENKGDTQPETQTEPQKLGDTVQQGITTAQPPPAHSQVTVSVDPAKPGSEKCFVNGQEVELTAFRFMGLDVVLNPDMPANEIHVKTRHQANMLREFVIKNAAA